MGTQIIREENKMKHTPGPWTHHWDKIGHDVRAADGGLIAAVGIGKVDWKHGDEHYRVANAHLIAAAPELLEACKDAIFVLETLSPKSAALISCRAAIAKAEGR